MNNTVNGWTFDPAAQNWYANVPAGADPRVSGSRTLLWTSDYDDPPNRTPAQVLAATNVNGRTRTT